MPIGCMSTVPHIMAHMYQRHPKRVLDLGIGMGFYGAAIRQWLDAGYAPSFKTRIDGVEGFEGYRNPCWQLYNRLDICSIKEALAAIKEEGVRYDAIILADVIEHFDLEEGREVVRTCCEFLLPGGCFYVATPAVFMEQGAAYGNEFERHRSLWRLADFEDLAAPRRLEVLQSGAPDEFGNQMLTVVFHNDVNPEAG